MKKKVFALAMATYTVATIAQTQQIYTIAGNGTGGHTGDAGQASVAELSNPYKTAFDAAGNMYISDNTNRCIRKVTTAGIISTFAGTGANGYTGDGGQATDATLDRPAEITFDTKGNLYIADYPNNAIRMINTNGIISTIAGNGGNGYNGDGGQATDATLYGPSGIILDNAGNLYIADTYNNRVRMVNSNGIISTLAGDGTPNYSGDGGQATAAEVNTPIGLSLDAAGNLYLADQNNNSIRMITAAGVISTVVGGTSGFSGDGGQATAAQISAPSGVTFDVAGNMYIADRNNNRIRMVTTAGIISTVAGNGSGSYNGDGIDATTAQLNAPTGVSFDASGRMYIGDYGNNRIRTVYIPGAALNLDGIDDNVQLPRSVTNDFTIEYWMRTTQTAGGGSQWYNGSGVVDAEASGVVNDFGTGLVGSNLAFGIGNPDVTIVSASAVNTGAWVHVAATWQESTGAMNLYINGILENSGTSGTGPRTDAPNIYIGTNNDLGSYYQGDVDEVRIWNRVLCVTEIQNSMNGELKLPQSGLAAYYRLNQGVAAGTNTLIITAVDSSGNGNDGTLNNFALTGANSNWVAPGGVATGINAPAFMAPVINISGATSICAGTSTTFTANGDAGNTYLWDANANSATTNTVVVTPTGTASVVYSVVGTNSVGCVSNTATTTLSINALPTVTVNSGSVCAGSSFTLTAGGADTYTYSSGSAVVTPTASTTNYTVSGTDVNNCVGTASNTVTVNALPSITVNSGSVCAGSSFTLTAGGADTYTYSSGSAIVTPTASTTNYTVSGTDVNNCVGTASNTVTVNALPNVNATINTATVCTGTLDTLNASGATSYVWSSNANSAITTTVSIAPTANDTYTVTGTDGNGCVNTNTVSVDVQTCNTGINRVANNMQVTVYPNPSNGNFSIASVNITENTMLVIYNSIGQVVYTQQLSKTVEVLNTNLDNGMYTLKLQNTQGVSTQHIIIAQ